MNYKHDEILNKYVDNELDSSELKQVDNLLVTDNNFRNLLKVHKYVHESLHDIPLKHASEGFTESLMQKIMSRISDKYKKNHLFTFVVSVLSSILVLILFVFFYFLGDLEIIKNVSGFTNSFSDTLIPSFSSIKEIINSNVFKTITGLLSFIVLIIFYFNYNSHKALKDTLKKL